LNELGSDVDVKFKVDATGVNRARVALGIILNELGSDVDAKFKVDATGVKQYVLLICLKSSLHI
jgi:hypothetical protein